VAQGLGTTATPVSQQVLQGAHATISVALLPGYVNLVVTGGGGSLVGSTYTTGPILADTSIEVSASAITSQITVDIISPPVDAGLMVIYLNDRPAPRDIPLVLPITFDDNLIAPLDDVLMDIHRFGVTVDPIEIQAYFHSSYLDANTISIDGQLQQNLVSVSPHNHTLSIDCDYPKLRGVYTMTLQASDAAGHYWISCVQLEPTNLPYFTLNLSSYSTLFVDSSGRPISGTSITAQGSINRYNGHNADIDLDISSREGVYLIDGADPGDTNWVPVGDYFTIEILADTLIAKGYDYFEPGFTWALQAPREARDTDGLYTSWLPGYGSWVEFGELNP